MLKRLSSLFGARPPTPPAAAPDAAAHARAEALKNEGNQALAAGALDAAERSYTRALSECPDYAPALNNLGHIRVRQQRRAEARDYFQRAVRADPQLAHAHFSLAELARDEGDTALAALHFERCLAAAPGHEDALLGLAHALFVLGRRPQAESRLRQALDAGLETANVRCYLGNVAVADGRLDLARQEYEAALNLDPACWSALIGLNTVLQKNGEWLAALARLRAMADAAPPDCQVALATLLLRAGELPEGFARLEHRFDTSADQYPYMQALRQRFTGRERWRGGPLAGRRLLVWAEQGLGDMLMFARYLPGLRAQGAGQVLLCCQPHLTRLLAAQGLADSVTSHTAPPAASDFDVYCLSMSLPHLLDAARHGPGGRPAPYLQADAAACRPWAERLASLPGLKVGVVWAGNPAHVDDAERSIPLAQLAPLWSVPDVSFVSLQKQDHPNRALGTAPLVDWMAECTDMADTAALVSGLDLVIAVDTAIVHLAGALGREVWMMNRFQTDWRWGIGQTQSPWYPAMRIFNQATPGAWAEVVDAVAGALRQRSAAHPR